MERKHIHLTKQQVKALETISRRTGVPVAELVRRAIDAMLKEMVK